MHLRRLWPLVVAAAACAHTPPPSKPAATKPPTDGKPSVASLHLPIQSFTLDNGLRVVLVPDHATPTVALGVYYDIGFRAESRDRTGFAHLFEHMMFQGSPNLGKMQLAGLISSNGGMLNAATRFDFTGYYEVIPANTLQTILWAEADRMRGLVVTDAGLHNQKDIVANEIRHNVTNKPYGGWPWLIVPQQANQNWYNAHNFYGEGKDLEHATLAEVQQFFHRYYVPNNAALVIVGDFNPAVVHGWVTIFFGSVARGAPVARPDLTEPRQEQPIVAERVDKLAKEPALAVAYHLPPRNSPAFFAFALIDEILRDGHDSALYKSLVRDKGLTGQIDGGINLLGSQFDYRGPMLWIVSAFYDRARQPDELVNAIEATIANLRDQPVSAATLARARIKLRSHLYTLIEENQRITLLGILAAFALFDNDAEALNRLESNLMNVTPELIQFAAREYLRPTNRTISKL
ncbi:MAG TPA: pitrilysin family protein, partial [Polyangia bacterium]|nr:pitrilysin family protein [Polyangia bacterium]